MTRIAFLGTGIMGAPMATRLAEAGHAVVAWNRTRARADRLAPAGIAVADTVQEAVSQSEIIVIMLADGPAVAEVLFGEGARIGRVAEAIRPGSLIIDMSSIPPPTAREHGRRLKEQGIGHLDAPVSGGEVGAKAGTLAIMAGGERAAFERAGPVFAPLGRAVHVGPAGSGQIAKLCNQLIVGITIGAVGEALLLARTCGADPAAVREALSGGFADSRILSLHGKRMLERAFDPGAKVTTQIKDLETVRSVAQDSGLTLPLSGLAAGLFRTLDEQGDGDRDHSALLLALERINGVVPE